MGGEINNMIHRIYDALLPKLMPDEIREFIGDLNEQR